MKRLFPLLFLLLTVLPARPAAPTFGQVMWTNDLAKVLLSPERETNRVQLPTNLTTFGGVSASFPALWREGTTLNARLADNSAFGPFTGGLLRSRTAGMILDTEDSATANAYSFFFRKKGDTGNTNSALANGAELGNLQWQGWDGSAYNTAVGWLPKTEQAWVAGVSLGAHMELRLTPSNATGFAESHRFAFVNGTNCIMTFNGISAGHPSLKRFGRFLQVRSADDSGFADFAVSNININGVTYLWTPTQATVPSVATNDGTSGANGVGWLPISALGGAQAIWVTNAAGVLSAMGGVANAQSIINGAFNSIDPLSPFSVIVGGRSNVIETGFGGHFIGGGLSNRIFGASIAGSNNVVVGGRENTIAADTTMASIGGGYRNRIATAVLQANGAVIAGGYQNTNVSLGGFIGAGVGNKLGASSADYAAIVAGYYNINQGADYGFQGGGFNNTLQGSAQISVVVGGEGGDIASDHAFLGGGKGNYMGAGLFGQILGGVSNSIPDNNPDLTTVIGNWGTNATPKSILLSPVGKVNGSNELHITATATTNIGPLKVQMGNATTAWAGVGGVLWATNFPIYNAGVAETNLVSVTIPAHTLSNLNSSLIIEASGSMAKSIAGTNQIRLLFGSQVLMDTGLQTASNGWYRIRATIASSSLTAGFTNQFTSADHFWWGTGVTGMPWRDTNFNNWTTQTNGINTTLSLATTSRRNGGITNESFRVRWVPNTP